jgi:peptidoglycan/LPS O-acetylase OafA/YrhL
MKLISCVVKDVTLFTGVKAGVPGVFETSAYPEALNGSLWTLPYEVKMYVVLVGLLAACRYRIEALIILFVAGATISALAGFGVVPPFQIDQFWLLFSIMFLTGSAIAAVQLAAGFPIALGFVVFTALLSLLTGSQLFANELLLVVVVVALGNLSAPNWLQPPLDISYGTYLYAWPVQQLSALYFGSFWSAFVFSLSLTFVLATLSAVFIERPALRLKIKPMHTIPDARPLPRPGDAPGLGAGEG